MPGFNISNPVSSEVDTVQFGFLSTEDVLSISVKQIVNPITFDGNGAPRDGGLYDSALGPFTRSIACSTCNLSGDNCPGHVGHISLPTPVYHPVFFDQLLRLLRSTCVWCHRLRMARAEVNRYVCKLRLIQYGLLKEVAELDEIQSKKTLDHAKPGNDRYGDDVMKDTSDQSSDESSSKEDDSDGGSHVDSLLKKRNAFVAECVKRHRQSGGSTTTKTSTIYEVRKILVREFLKDIAKGKRCQSCKGISPTFRKDGSSKLFEVPLSVKDQSQMMQLGFVRVNSILKGNAIKELSLHEKGAAPALSDVQATKTSDAKTGRILTALEVFEHMSLLFDQEKDIMNLLYRTKSSSSSNSKMRNRVSARMFFLHAIAVPPTPFRAPTVTGKELNENTQNTSLKKILETCLKIRDLNDDLRSNEKSELSSATYGKLVREFVILQEDVNNFIDGSKSPASASARALPALGIKQILEKKEGLFRMNMMGKRVNFAARSVISPDPNIETSEIGVPLVFARKLTYPEPVTPHNVELMRQAVINGPDHWPGATHIEFENGRVQRLPASLDSRKGLANQLLTPSDANSKSYNKKVYRHVQNGDMVLMNRQPTLHKPSIMGHRVRVLKKENTIRMHYANCNTYNADFDGDEMNMHLPQNENARAEAQMIANTDSQYLVATSGKPLRGLIQDHIAMGVYMTKRDTFFTKGEFQQLLYSCLRPEDEHTSSERIVLLPPAVMKPRKLWTGKQVISCILLNIKPQRAVGLNLESKSQTPGTRWGADSEEGKVIFHNGDLVSGVLDKAQFGASAFGLVHSVYEVYGNALAGSLLSILGRLFTKFLHMRAFTCGMDDLLLSQEGDRIRRSEIDASQDAGHEVHAKYVGLEASKTKADDALFHNRLEDVLRDDTKQANLDGVMNSRNKNLTSSIIAKCLPNGLVKPFPKNQMQAMTVSGAKGSDVNASQISCCLGQQVLEGRRVPVMVSGKTLPSFSPFDTKARAGGYITDRFLTGIRPQEYYFHAMAGREGLIDTAVKTSRSGYLQRCLIKGMEGMTVQYDSSVRDSDGSLVQFLYGEDSLDVTKQKHLLDFKFHASNAMSFVQKLKLDQVLHLLDLTTAAEYQKNVMKKSKKSKHIHIGDPTICVYPPGKYVGSVSENFTVGLEKYIKDNQALFKEGALKKTAFRTLMNIKYMNSVIEPGEAVGILAGQSVGEPSTQMTLNTFHLAGHSTKNVTLGIPRLREIVMTATASISTPQMTIMLQDNVSDEVIEQFTRRISKVTLGEVVDNVSVSEFVSEGTSKTPCKIYKIRLNLFPREHYEKEYSVTQDDVVAAIEREFLARLRRDIKKQHAKAGSSPSMGKVDSMPAVGKSKRARAEVAATSADYDEEGDEADDGDSDDDVEDDAKRQSRATDNMTYENPDEAENEIAKGIQDEDEDMDHSDEEDKENTTSSEDDKDLSERAPSNRIRKAKLKEREDLVRSNHEDVSKFEFDDLNGQWCEFELEYPVDVAKLLMVSLVEQACRSSVLHQLKNIAKCDRAEDDTTDRENPKRRIATEGVNFHAMWDYDHIVKTDQIFTNDIAAMLVVYGVEAARSTIVREMSAVFSGHGIAVDSRHLNLIADIMTRGGGFTPFNRLGLRSDVSPFLKMSFETTCQFLKDATLDGDNDDLRSPSARIVLGRLSKVGTGSFDVLTRVS